VKVPHLSDFSNVPKPFQKQSFTMVFVLMIFAIVILFFFVNTTLPLTVLDLFWRRAM
jgi:hypothetical protein